MSVTVDPIIRDLVEQRGLAQDLRMRLDNKIRAAKAGESNISDRQIALMETWRERWFAVEVYASEDIKREIESVPIIERMTAVKGIGPLLSAQLISLIDISIPNTISGLWRYCGYGVTDEGRAERRVKGQKISYNPKAKTICWNIAGSFLKSGSPYRKVYDRAKERYQQTKTDWTPAHIHNAALRKMVKMFLAHLWFVWREMEGLPTRTPYSSEYLDHSTIEEPSEYGW